MTPNTKSTIIYTTIFAILAVGGFLAYKKWLSPKAVATPVSKSDKVNYILDFSTGMGSYQGLLGLDDNFINDWYNGLKNKQRSFTSGAGRFDIVTGKEIA